MTALQIVQKFYPAVTAVKDAGRNLRVEVTEADTKSKGIKNQKTCVFAKACHRTRSIDGAVISLKIAYLIKGNKAVRFSIPESLSREIIAFDRNGNFETGLYKLLKPKRSLGSPAATGSNNRSKRGRKVQYRHVTQNIRSL